ncbi:MAG: 50S ribosomal protein L23 [Myxococcota bacterium]|nr:50S ribosomal protein L23 [Myxococcota bacterium]
MNVHQVIQRPLQTEKSMIGRDERNLATFAVDRRANKLEIKQAVEELFDVRVKKVRTMQQQGKKRRVGRIVGRKPAWKKAIVELAEGHSIEFFEGV